MGYKKIPFWKCYYLFGLLMFFVGAGCARDDSSIIAEINFTYKEPGKSGIPNLRVYGCSESYDLGPMAYGDTISFEIMLCRKYDGLGWFGHFLTLEWDTNSCPFKENRWKNYFQSLRTRYQVDIIKDNSLSENPEMGCIIYVDGIDRTLYDDSAAAN